MKYFTLTAAALLTIFALPATANESAATEASSVASGEVFVKKRYSIKGGWDIVKQDGQTIIRFDQDFKTKSGPDLKVFLSKSPVGALNGKTAQYGAVKIAVLQSNRGQQSYILPDDIDISEFQSVLIHCEAYSVLWGGFDIAEADNAP